MSFEYADLRDTIVASVRKGSEGKDVGVAFSGGLDSGLVSAIAKEYANSVTLYTCGTDTSFDTIMARELSEKLELPWVHAKISKDNVESIIKEMIASTGESDSFTLSYEMQLYCVCKASDEKIILTGQGCDEYFMGCAKFVDCPDPDYEILVKECVDRLWDVSMPCESAIADHFGQELVYPYLDETVIAEINKIDPAVLRPKDMDSRKSVLRDVAMDLGYPIISKRKKKSSQYGSGTTDIIRALSKEKGMFYNQYVKSLYDEVMGKE
ncbi:MAG TPA: asparagine synthase-related protein [Candidatus Methanomethylophilaceae archaeon]|nr:asparagine synthase-related protein [Candidatus Methanomethylophilaceae archaeon]